MLVQTNLNLNFYCDECRKDNTDLDRPVVTIITRNIILTLCPDCYEHLKALLLPSYLKYMEVHPHDGPSYKIYERHTSAKGGKDEGA